MTDVDFLRRIIRVETQYSTYGEGSTADASKRGFAVTKTRNSVREIPVPESLLHAINAHVARYGLSYAGTICVGERTRVVNGARARAPMTRKRWDRAWGDACTSTGIAGFTAHSLRHAFGSEHLAAGIPPADCAAWLGHTVDTFLRTYARPTGERARPTIDMLAAETCTNRAQGESAPG
jgi:integrase